jgi:hypothetical protein
MPCAETHAHLEEPDMRRIIGTIGAILAIALMTPTLALASNHREATKILKDPTADNTDVYAAIGAPIAVLSIAALLVPLLRGRDDHGEHRAGDAAQPGRRDPRDD